MIIATLNICFHKKFLYYTYMYIFIFIYINNIV